MRKQTTILFLMLVAAFTAPAQTRERAILDEQALRRVAAQETPRVRRMTDSLDAFKRAAGLGAEFSFRKGRVYTDQYGDTHLIERVKHGHDVMGICNIQVAGRLVRDKNHRAMHNCARNA